MIRLCVCDTIQVIENLFDLQYYTFDINENNQVNVLKSQIIFSQGSMLLMVDETIPNPLFVQIRK